MALRYQLLSRFTARVAVEERVERQPDGERVTVRVPTELPRGWNPSSFYATATQETAWLLSAAGLLSLGALSALAVRRREAGRVH